jgi:pyridoxamine 5'-phosphate oxidase
MTTPPEKPIFSLGANGEDSQAAQFTRGSLDASQCAANPLDQFHTWFRHAQKSEVSVPEACTLATASLPDGKVSARVVYLKGLDDSGFIIYSNWDTSRKAQDIRTNPQAALTFWWKKLERQIRIEGTVERLSSEQSQIYYDTRIRGSRIGAWASQQSAVLRDRQELEDRVKEVEKRFDGQDKFPAPEFWGGLRVIPDTMEFWQGRESRLHDRIRYLKDDKEASGWKMERLSP